MESLKLLKSKLQLVALMCGEDLSLKDRILNLFIRCGTSVICMITVSTTFWSFLFGVNLFSEYVDRLIYVLYNSFMVSLYWIYIHQGAKYYALFHELEAIIKKSKQIICHFLFFVVVKKQFLENIFLYFNKISPSLFNQ